MKIKRKKWLEWAMELQGLAQGALYYCKDKYDIERFERIREISAEILSEYTDLSVEKVTELFCGEKGYQTPKIDVRAAVFRESKVLLVQEENGLWSMPGGWADADLSVKENTIKEVKEEAGLDVSAGRVIAIQDRKNHNIPLYAYNICKIFVECTVLGGHFVKNLETVDSGWFSQNDLPPLAEDKITEEQIEMCFQASKNPQWRTVLE